MNRIPLFAALALSASCHAAVTLQLTTTVHRELSEKTQSSAPTDSRTTADVTLADDYIAVKSADGATIYDFRNRRRVVLDAATKTYVEYSLYDTLGFRVIEMMNRVGLNQMMAAVPDLKLKQHRKVDIEQELAIADDSATVIEASAAGDTLQFSNEGQALAAWSKRGATVGAADAARFAQVLRYTMYGHPQVLAKLTEGGVIPDSLTLTVRNSFGVQTVQVAATQVKNATPPAYTLQGYARRQAAPAQDWMNALIDRMAALTPEQLAAMRAAHPCDQAAELREGQLLDALLSRIECTLATGAPMPQFTPEEVAKLRADPAVSRAFQATSVNQKEGYAAAIDTLVELRSHAPRKAYILKLFEANNRGKLGQRKESLQLFSEVLEANPLLGGAYKDLGDLMMMSFDTPSAWRIWDAGRRIAPAGPNFHSITQFETEIVKRHPEYLVY